MEVERPRPRPLEDEATTQLDRIWTGQQRIEAQLQALASTIAQSVSKTVRDDLQRFFAEPSMKSTNQLRSRLKAKDMKELNRSSLISNPSQPSIGRTTSVESASSTSAGRLSLMSATLSNPVSPPGTPARLSILKARSNFAEVDRMESYDEEASNSSTSSSGDSTKSKKAEEAVVASSSASSALFDSVLATPVGTLRRPLDKTETLQSTQTALAAEHIGSTRSSLQGFAESLNVASEPLDWLKSIAPRKVICQQSRKSGSPSAFFQRSTTAKDLKHQASGDRHGNSDRRSRAVQAAPPLRRLPLDPESYLPIFLKAMSVIALCHDLVRIPYVIAWEGSSKGSFGVLAWAVAAFWSVDLGSGFFIGYYQDGELEIRMSHVASYYLQTRFVPNVIALLCDMASLFLEYSNAFIVLSRLLRIADFLRIIRFYRLFEELVDRTLVESNRMLMQGSMLVIAIFWFNHIICCAWWAIGKYGPSDTGSIWFDTLVVDPDDRGYVYEYFTSFHWALSQQIAGGLEGISPLNTIERQFNIFCLLFGLLFVSFIVSSLSANLTHLMMQKQDQTEKLRELRLYLVQKAATPKMCVRVQRQVEERMAKRRKLVDSDVRALDYLSTTLRVELNYELMGPHVLQHPIMRLCEMIDSATIGRLCSECVAMQLLEPGDTLFIHGSDAHNTFFVISGRLSYTLHMAGAKTSHHLGSWKTGTSIASGDKDCILPGRWVSEAALWTQWTHIGDAQAMEPCEVLALDCKKSLQILLKQQLIRDIVSEYAMQFHRRLVYAATQQDVAYYDMPTDVEVPFTDFCELVLAMDFRVQCVISGISIEGMRYAGVDVSKLEKLEAEIQDGRSCVVINAKGEVERAVAVTVLKLEGEDSRYLTQIAKIDDAGLASLGLMPAVKQVTGEGPLEAAQRLIKDLQSIVADGAKIICSTREVTWKPSPTYGTRTRYLRTVHVAKLVSTQSELTPVAIKKRKKTWGSFGKGEQGGAPISVAALKDIHEAEQSGYRLADSHPVYLIKEGACAGLYAWLAEEQLEELSKPPRRILDQWIKCLDLPLIDGSESESLPQEGKKVLFKFIEDDGSHRNSMERPSVMASLFKRSASATLKGFSLQGLQEDRDQDDDEDEIDVICKAKSEPNQPFKSKRTSSASNLISTNSAPQFSSISAADPSSCIGSESSSVCLS